MQSTDRNGNVHQYSYDVLGRLTSDAVTTLGTGVDGSVQRITYGYDSQGNQSLITSYNAASGGAIANQVQRFFNGLGQLTTEYQSHNGAVDIPYTPEVEYAYTEMSGGQNNSRLVSMTYPDGYQLLYNYNSGLDNNISRLSSLSDSSGRLESYLYLGLNTVVERDHPQTGVNLTYIRQIGDSQYNSDGGDQYTGLDRFGRVIDQFWINASTGTTVDRYQYGYNQDSEVLYRENLVDTAMSELYQYDNLHQLSYFARGTLNASHNGIVGSPSHSQSWTPDALGNFTSIVTDGTGQSRTANQQNEYTSISGQSAPEYDADGNLVSYGNGMVYAYDAWNRLVTVKNEGTVVASYGYDGLNRRIQTSESNSLTDSYYSSSDQVLENYQGGAVTAFGVWSPVYVNALVYWARGSGAGATRYYALQDANWNVTAWVVAGTVVEREAYDPFGAVTGLSPSWGVQSSPLQIAIGFQGMGYDWLVALNFADNRVYNPAFMRWQQTDPSGLSAGVNVYEMEGNGPTDATDPSGLRPWMSGSWGDWFQAPLYLISFGYLDGTSDLEREGRILDATRQMMNRQRRQINPSPTYTNPNSGGYADFNAMLNRSSAQGSTAGTMEAASGGTQGAALASTPFWVMEMFRFLGEQAGKQLLENYAAGRVAEFIQFLQRVKGIKAIRKGAITKAELEAAAKEFASAPKAPARGWRCSNRWDTGENARILRRNMGSAVKAGEDAHHIVLSTGTRADPARRILTRYQVDINDATNGVGLKPTGDRPAHHGQGLHSYAGIDAVNRRLEAAVNGITDWAVGRMAVLAELERIRTEILNGTFP